jgi:hypothetical protein
MAADLRYEGATIILGCVISFFVFIYLIRLFFLKSEGFEDTAAADTKTTPSCPPLSPAVAAAAKAAEEAEKDKECGTRGLSPAAKAAAAAADAATAAKVAQVEELAKNAAKKLIEEESKAAEKPEKPNVKKDENDIKSFSVKCPSGDKPIISYMGSFGGVGTLKKSDFGDDDDELEGASKCNLSSSTPAPVNNQGCPKNPYNFNPAEDN